MPDIPAITSVAHARGALVIDDNTWATPLYHRSLDQGVDISMQAATKYIGGHSDIMFGTISANAKTWPIIAEAIRLLGVCAGPDDVFLALRGLRTLAVRLSEHHRSALDIARWLSRRAEGLTGLHPALATSSVRTRHGAMARDAARGPQGVAPCSRNRSGPCDLEAGFHRRVRPVQYRSEAGAAKGRRCIARRGKIVRHGLFMGRLREPCHSIRLRALSHGHQMGAGRTNAAPSYRAGERRGSQGRSRARVCGLQRSVAPRSTTDAGLRTKSRNAPHRPAHNNPVALKRLTLSSHCS